MANKDHDPLSGIVFPQDYEGLLTFARRCALVNIRLGVVVVNQQHAIEEILTAYQAEDAHELHAVLDRYQVCKDTAEAIQQAQISAGIDIAFPTIQ